jgi:hypothetical protein
MTRTLLIIAGIGALICFACLGVVHALGGWNPRFDSDGHPAPEPGPEASRDIPWTGAEALHIGNSAATITYTQGPSPRFTVTGPKNRIDQIGIEGDTITGTDVHFSMGDDDRDRVHMTIVSPNTHAFYLSGDEVLTLQGYDQDDLDIDVSGAAKVKGEGHAKSLDVHLSGAGALNLAKLPVDKARVSISGAGAVRLDPKQSADISISGAGSVRLLTRPPQLTTHISGIGKISTPEGSQASIGGAINDSTDKHGKSKDDDDDDDD